jgi:hypothetical protein
VAVFLLGQSVSAQENLQTQEQVAKALGSQGFVPVSLLEGGLESCLSMMDNGSSDSERRLSLEYCGAMLINTFQNAMKFRVGDVQQTVKTYATSLTLDEALDRLAAALAAQIAAEVALEEEKRRSDLLLQQVAALRRQLSSLEALLDVAEEDKATAQAQLEALGGELNATLARLAKQERERRQAEGNK